jgi:hypothetical protein
LPDFSSTLFAVGIVGLRRLREPVTLRDLGVQLALLSAGLVTRCLALGVVRGGEDVAYIALPAGVTQGLAVAAAVLGLLAVAIGVCGVGLMAVDYFLHPPNRSS